MKYIITSDTHFDFLFKDSNLSPTKILNSLRHNKLLDYFSPKDDEPHTLIVAGDIGHNPEQNVKVLRCLKSYFKYSDIIIVFGNHDYYNTSRGQRKNFPNIHIKEEYILNLYRESGIIVLNGDIVEHYGKKIMGFPAWYDGSYLTEFGYEDSVESLWESTMNDSRLIPLSKGNGMYYLLKFQMDKVMDIPEQKVDMIITHFCPLVGDRYVAPEFLGEYSNAFYQFNGDYLRDKFSPDIWVYGHTHQGVTFREDGIKYYCNPLGYPVEFNNKIRFGELKAEII